MLEFSRWYAMHDGVLGTASPTRDGPGHDEMTLTSSMLVFVDAIQDAPLKDSNQLGLANAEDDLTRKGSAVIYADKDLMDSLRISFRPES